MTAPRPRTAERGAALLTVLVAVAVLTALAADVAYESRVSLRIAANARDELRAEYQARSGVALSRLVLSFQQQLDRPLNMPGGNPAPRIQLWRAVPVSSELVAGLFGGSGGSPFAGSLFDQPAQGARSAAAAVPASNPAAPSGGPGAKAGPATAAAPAQPPGKAPEATPRPAGGGAAFDAVIEDEGTKINAQFEESGGTASFPVVVAQVLALYHLICDPRWDPLFDREDANGVKTSREELLVRLREWVDEGKTTFALQAAFGAASCSMTLPRMPVFESGFGDENAPYDRGEDRYKAKNAHMDSLDELYLIAGVGDAFMAAFGEQLTVYLPRSTKWNVDDRSRLGILSRAAVFADPAALAQNLIVMRDPAFIDRVQEQLFLADPLGIFAISPQQYVDAFNLAGLRVSPRILQEARNLFAASADTFRIKSTGTSGDVKTTIEAIVRLDSQQQGQAQVQALAQPTGAPGRVIHWRED